MLVEEEEEMPDESADGRLRELLDRQEIMDCLLRYTRGVDRLDLDLVRSAFHPDARDCHGPISGNAAEFLDWWLPAQPRREATQHYLMNHTVEIDGDVAHAETYYLTVIKEVGMVDASLYGGRYADRLERRDGEWKIAVRVVLPEWGAEVDASRMSKVFDLRHRGSRDRQDPTYERPLRVRPPIQAIPPGR